MSINKKKKKEEEKLFLCLNCCCMTYRKEGYVNLCGKCGKDRRHPSK